MMSRIKWILSGAILAAVAISGGTLLLDARREQAVRARQEQRRLAEDNQRLLAEQQRLRAEAERLEAERQQLSEIVDRLNIEQRVAYIDVLQQHRDELDRVRQTVIRMTEIGRDGNPLPPQVFGVAGAVPHFDALVIKFDDAFVADGDQLRGRSLALFRRVYGDSQAPLDGYWLGKRSEVPDVYRVTDSPSEFERELWRNFWTYATDPVKARDAGVRVAQGEAVYAPMQPGERWTLTLEADGGLNLIKDDLSVPSAEEVATPRGEDGDRQQLHAPPPLNDEA